ncbi:DUF1194 domain-containing protein [Roseovarius nanhaiticus]|uniref:DUF1194 domain-containing protein n=1 Tax=Roseovarius nanhaiticus TaxID=573024 RepID=UPI0024929A3C|nr:DUF1194 domain-containing protein [Roseovarius nanhaiticus]
MAALLWGAPLTAQAQCRLALVLALDVSASVDAEEYDLQRLGLAAALDAPDVRDAILRGQNGSVALAVFEWSGRFQQDLHLDWTLLQSHADIDRAVLALGNISRSFEGYPTSVGQALGYAASLLKRGPACDRRVIDMSGDGINNYGYGPAEAYRHFPLRDVQVNGLVILGDDAEVEAFYRREVIRGPGAFVELSAGFEGFRAAMTRKLFREINDMMLGHADAPRLSPHG